VGAGRGVWCDTIGGAALSAFYLLGKAMLIAHASTASFNASGERALCARSVQWLVREKNKDGAAAARKEREAASNRRALPRG
jgi:hypothetical protein